MTAVVQETTSVDTHTEEAKLNKISNEEFKIWKKAIPTFYKHISTFKPHLHSNVTNQSRIHKTVVFTDKMFPDVTKGTLTTSVLLALGADIYEIDVILPIGAHFNSTDNVSNVIPQYDAFLKNFEQTKFEPKWKILNDTVEKLYFVNNNSVKFIAVTKKGSVLYFKDEISTATAQYTAESVEINHSVDVRSDLSSDLSTIVLVSNVTKNVTEAEKEEITTMSSTTSIKILDNVEKPGDVKKTINMKDIPHCESCKFLKGKDMIALCDSESTIRFWDLLKAEDKPSLTIIDNTEGKLTSFATSSIIPTIFITGSENGTFKLYDIRLLPQDKDTIDLSKETEYRKEIATLSHFDNDSVADIIFSQISACKFITVGKSGNVYHWDMSYLFSQGEIDGEDNIESSALQSECLSFYHTGGFRRVRSSAQKRNTVAADSIVDDLICTVDADNLLTVYIPFTARVEESDESTSGNI